MSIPECFFKPDKAEDFATEPLQKLLGVVSGGIVLRFGGDPNVSHKLGQTALRCAANSGNPAKAEIMRMLLAYGADVHCLDRWLHSAVHCVIWCCGNLECVKLLLGAGADVDATNSGGYTPLSWAAMFGRTQSLDHHLLTGHANPTIPNCDDFTPLFFSIQGNSS